VYRVAHDHFLIVVNASNIDKDYRHFVENVGTRCQIDNESDTTALIAFQGPKAEAALSRLTHADLARLRSFCFLPDRQVAGRPAWIARAPATPARMASRFFVRRTTHQPYGTPSSKRRARLAASPWAWARATLCA